MGSPARCNFRSSPRHPRSRGVPAYSHCCHQKRCPQSFSDGDSEERISRALRLVRSCQNPPYLSPILMLARRRPRASMEPLQASMAPCSSATGSRQRSSVRSCHFPGVRPGGIRSVLTQHHLALQGAADPQCLPQCCGSDRGAASGQELKGAHDVSHRVHIRHGGQLWGRLGDGVEEGKTPQNASKPGGGHSKLRERAKI